MFETSTSNSPDSAISWKTRGKTIRSSSIAQQSAGLPTWSKFGNSSVIRARSCSEKSWSGMPACSALSAKYSPSPPELVTAPIRAPRGGFALENTSRCSNQVPKSSQRMAP